MATGWQSDNGNWYWFNGSGVMQTGWQSIGGSWYYFDGSGAMSHDQWVGDYYLTGSGAMATNTWVGGYYVNGSGAWVPGYGQSSSGSGSSSSSGWDGVTVYWTKSGTKYHKSVSCPTLSNSSVIKGTISQVGTRDLCKVCGH